MIFLTRRQRRGARVQRKKIEIRYHDLKMDIEHLRPTMKDANTNFWGPPKQRERERGRD